MTNKIILKKSSVTNKVPLTTDLDYGELALNYADGKLYHKTSGNTIDLFPSATSTATLTNKTLSSATLSGDTNVTGSFTIAATGGDEGGEIKLATAPNNNTLAAGTIAIDIYQNKVRIFETNGNNRGVYIDLRDASNSVGTNLLNSSSSSSWSRPFLLMGA